MVGKVYKGGLVGNEMKLQECRFSHINNWGSFDEASLKSMGESLKDWKGFVEEKTFVDSDNLMLIKQIKPINGTPAKKFRESIEKAWLVGNKFFNLKEEKE